MVCAWRLTLCQRLLDDPVDVDRGLGTDDADRPLRLEVRADAVLPSELLDEPFERLLEPEVVEDTGCSSRDCDANPLERLLRDAAHLLEVADERRVAGAGCASRGPAACRRP